MAVHEEVRMVLSSLFGEDWRERLFKAVEPAGNIRFPEPFAPESEYEKRLLAMSYLSQEIGHEAWKLGKVLSVQKRKFESGVVYGNHDSLWEMNGHEEEENVPFKAVREGDEWRYFFRHNKWSPWEEYILPFPPSHNKRKVK
jgi:hypothetical protein